MYFVFSAAAAALVAVAAVATDAVAALAAAFAAAVAVLAAAAAAIVAAVLAAAAALVAAAAVAIAAAAWCSAAAAKDFCVGLFAACLFLVHMPFGLVACLGELVDLLVSLSVYFFVLGIPALQSCGIHTHLNPPCEPYHSSRSGERVHEPACSSTKDVLLRRTCSGVILCSFPKYGSIVDSFYTVVVPVSSDEARFVPHSSIDR